MPTETYYASYTDTKKRRVMPPFLPAVSGIGATYNLTRETPQEGRFYAIRWQGELWHRQGRIIDALTKVQTLGCSLSSIYLAGKLLNTFVDYESVGVRNWASEVALIATTLGRIGELEPELIEGVEQEVYLPTQRKLLIRLAGTIRSIKLAEKSLWLSGDESASLEISE